MMPAKEALERLLHDLRAAMLLCGARTVGQMRSTPAVITGRLKSWLDALG